MRVASQFLSMGLLLTAAASGADRRDDRLAPTPVTQGLAELRAVKPQAQWTLRHGRVTRIYGPDLAVGVSPIASSDAFLGAHAAALGAEPGDLRPAAGESSLGVMRDRDSGVSRFHVQRYHQERQGIAVFDADLRIVTRNVEGHPVVLVSSTLRELGRFQITDAQRDLDPELGRAAIRPAVPDDARYSKPSLVIWAGGRGAAASPRLAASIIVRTTTALKWRFIVDAATGEILLREDLLNDIDVIGNVSGLGTSGLASEQCAAETLQAMPHAEVRIGGTTAVTDPLGDFTIPHSGTSSVIVQSELVGPWFDVDNWAGADALLNLSVTPPGPAAFVHNAGNTPLTRAEVNAWLSANAARDHVVAAQPGFPGTAAPFQVNVNRTDGICPQNAWYDPDDPSINFCQADGVAPNTAFSTIVYHEYGHHLIEAAGGGQGEYGEGMADSIAVLVTDEPEMGIGFNGPCSPALALRTADNNRQYPCAGGFHFCGQVLSGAVWDLRNELLITEPAQYRAILSDLTLGSIMLHTGIFIDPSIVVDFLTLDDVDGNLDNGTPHFSEICSAFGAHGISCPAINPIGFEYPNGLPERVAPSTPTFVRVDVVGLSGSPALGTGTISYRVNDGNFVTVPMVQLLPNMYQTLLPSVACGSRIEYYFSAQAMGGSVFTDPPDAPLNTFFTPAALALIDVVSFDFESDAGWTVSNSAGLTNGAWQRGNPFGNGSGGDPPTDADGSGQCWVTGNSANANVDGGSTTLTSPVFNLATVDNALVDYARWFDTSTGGLPDDALVVEVSVNNGLDWTAVELVGPRGAQAQGDWITRRVRLDDVVTPSAQTRLRILASDTGLGTNVEAGLDAFRIRDAVCSTCSDPCDDGDPCTINDQCAGAFCTGSPVDCSSSTTQCSTASCDPAGTNGNCDVSTPAANGTFCNDANPCLVGESCQGGACTGGTPPDCSAFGDACNTASCDGNGAEGNCNVIAAVPNGTACDDGAACLVGETCQSGACSGGAPPDCTPFEDQCTVASCDGTGTEGNCSVVDPIADGTACDDGDPCTLNDSCQAGVCAAGTPVDCSAFDDGCNTAACDIAGAIGNCDLLIPVADGTDCDDGLACSVGESCQAGTCAGGAPPDCSAFDNDCNTASCSANGVEGNCAVLTPVSDGKPCDDGRPCNTGESCQAGSCVGGSLVDCSAFEDDCNSVTCDIGGAEGNCDVITPVLDGTPCDDSLACNVGEACVAGTCQGGTPQDCSALDDDCNTVSCDTSGSEGNCDIIAPVLDGTPCDDGLACNVGEACVAGTCQGGGGQDCSAFNDDCNVVTCDAGGREGNCAITIPVANGTLCDDGLACNTGEACLDGSCVGGTSQDCSALNDDCNTVTCDIGGAEGNCDRITPVPDGTPCDDGLACSVGESCASGTCLGGAPQDCSALDDDCNTVSCDTSGSEGNCDTVTPLADGTPCDDGLACNVGETCQNGSCRAGAAQDCSSLDDDCNTVSCSPAGPEGNCAVVTPRADGTACDDGDRCSVGERCQSGACTAGTAPDCAAFDTQCTLASCNPLGLEGNCAIIQPRPDDTPCDDGAPCSVDDRCSAGDCRAGPPPDCAPFEDDCNTAACDPAGTLGNCDVIAPRPNGTSCDDGAVCTLGETCTNGVCGGGMPPDCTPFEDDCNTVSCDPDGAMGNCAIVTPRLDGTACDDGAVCTIGEACFDGVCGGGAAADCQPFDEDCRLASCDPAAQQLNCDILTPLPLGTPCDDGNACSMGDACDSGVCAAGAAVDCSAFDTDCAITSCNPDGDPGNCAGLTPMPDGTLCNDGDPCLVDDRCDAGVCQPGTPLDCSAFGSDCEIAMCDPNGSEGNCDLMMPAANGTPCDDDNPCLIGETCLDGACQAGLVVECPVEPCRTLSCDDSGAEGNCDKVTLVPDETPCEDDGVCLAGDCVVPCALPSDCGDRDGNGVADDACTWSDCVDQACVTVARTFADAGGPFGDCTTDGFVNIHDRLHVLTCFAGATACPLINLDLGGPFGLCPADGFCNIHDATHVDGAFSGATTCTCPPGASPEVPPAALDATRIVLVADDDLAGTVAVHAYLDLGVPDLKGYQLALRAFDERGDQRFARALSAAARGNAALADQPGSYEAARLIDSTLLVGHPDGLAVDSGAYLGTWWFDGIANRLTVELAIGGGYGSVLIDSANRPITILDPPLLVLAPVPLAQPARGEWEQPSTPDSATTPSPPRRSGTPARRR